MHTSRYRLPAGAVLPASAAQWCVLFGAQLAAIGGMVLRPAVIPG